MPTYEYKCETCETVFDVFHSMLEKPLIECKCCHSVCHKQVTGFYLGESKSLSSADIKHDLSENYGIESVSMLKGDLNTWYKGIKKDGQRVKEEMIQNKEKQQVKKENKTNAKEAEKRFLKIREEKAKKAYESKKITI